MSKQCKKIISIVHCLLFVLINLEIITKISKVDVTILFTNSPLGTRMRTTKGERHANDKRRMHSATIWDVPTERVCFVSGPCDRSGARCGSRIVLCIPISCCCCRPC